MFFIKGSYKTNFQGYMTVKLSYTTVNPSHVTVKFSFPTVTYKLHTIQHESTFNNLLPVLYRYLRRYAVCVEGNYGYLPRYSQPATFFRPP